jgi:formylglycine-generating enzyme required for sulfatase activity
MAFRLIPAGKFRMGSRGYNPNEEPVHEVEIPEPFWMAETPVTQAQFALWTEAEGIDHKNHFAGRPDHPAENMDWRQAVSFCDWLTRTKGAQFPDGFRLACLPTEAEWEYACRAETETEYYTGDGEAALAEAGWFGEDWDSGSTHPVRLKKANGFGLYDMHGNVWEWCHNEWDDTAYRGHEDGAPDSGAVARAKHWKAGLASMVKPGESRVLRGGSWYDTAWYCRSAFRYWSRPDGRGRNGGFRVCLVLGPSHQTDSQKARRSEPRETESDPPSPRLRRTGGAGVAEPAGVDLAKARFTRKSARSGPNGLKSK